MKFNISLFLLMFVILPMSVSANVIGSITTDKDLYDVNETILAKYTLSGSGNNNPLSTDIIVEGYMPSYNGNYMNKFDYMGSSDFEGGSGSLIFKTIKSIKLEDASEYSTYIINTTTGQILPLGGSSFIPIPPITGTFNIFAHPAMLGSGEFNDYLGKIVIYESTNTINKTIYITREKPSIFITNISMDKRNAFKTTDTIILNYFCKYNCSIKAEDVSLKATTSAFTYGINTTTNLKSLTTSDTNEWKQIVIPLIDTGYTPEDDFVKVTITDDNETDDFIGGKSIDTFFVYEPTNDDIRINKNIVFDVGTDTQYATTFNNSLGVIYNTKNIDRSYSLSVFQTPDSPYRLERGDPKGYPAVHYFISNQIITQASYPNNAAEFFLLDGSGEASTDTQIPYAKSLYNGFYNYFVVSEDNDITVDVTFQLNYYGRYWLFWHRWYEVNHTHATFRAQRTNMLYSTQGDYEQMVDQTPSEYISLKPIIEAFGFRGTAGHYIFAILMLFISFIALTRFVRLTPVLVLAFCTIEAWYMAYDGIIHMTIIAIVVLIVCILYTAALLRMLRTEGNNPPPQGGV